MNYELIAQSYRKNGFHVIRDFYPVQDIETIKIQVDRYYQQETMAKMKPDDVIFEEGSVRQVRCLFRMEKYSQYFRKLMEEHRLIQVLRALFDGDEVMGDIVQLIDKSPYASYEWPYHQDNAYQLWDPPEGVAVTIALDESTVDNGPIICLQGSHTIGILPHQPSGIKGASLGMRDVPDIETYPEVPLLMKPGDIALHHVNVIHRTGSNLTALHRLNLGFAYHSCRAKRVEGLTF